MLRRGFSLVELMVALAVLALLLLAAGPNFGAMVASARVRSAAETLQNALRLAQASAVQRNRQVVLVLTNDRPGLAAVPAANGVNWLIRVLPLRAASKTVDDASLFVQGGALSPGRITIEGSAQTCFNSLGRVVGNTTVYSGSKAAANFTAACAVSGWVSTFSLVSDVEQARKLNVQLRFGGQIRMCTPDATLAQSREACV